MEDKPGTLGICCRALAERRVNILAFEAFQSEGQSLIRMLVDNPAAAKTALEANGIYYTEAEVAHVKLAHRPGHLSRAASRLGENQININYSYCGTEPESNLPLVVFGVNDAAKAAALLDQFAKEENTAAA
jgi:hypothetical protein